MSGLAGRVGLVTAGGMGIGRGIALGLAAEGMHVAVLDVDGAAARAVAVEAQALGRRALACEADVRDYARVVGAVNAVSKALGPVEVLVNNAGGGHPDARFVELDPAEWDRVLGVCVYGALNVTRAVLPSMTERRFGRIVQIGSDVGRTGGRRASLYATAKAALSGFTHALAQEVAEYGVTVNTVSPGETETERTREHAARMASQVGEVEARLAADRARARIPLGRLAQPADVAAAVVFLCGAGSYVTGQTLSVNGGASMF